MRQRGTDVYIDKNKTGVKTIVTYFGLKDLNTINLHAKAKEQDDVSASLRSWSRS